MKDKIKKLNPDITVKEKDNVLTIEGEDRKLVISKNKNLYDVSCEFKSSGIAQNKNVKEINKVQIPGFVAEFMNPKILTRKLHDVVEKLTQTKNNSPRKSFWNKRIFLIKKNTLFRVCFFIS